MEVKILDPSRKQIHVISAGKSMNETFKSVLRKFRADGIIIFREMVEVSRSDSKEEKEIDNASKELYDMANTLNLSFEEVKVPQNDVNAVRNEILRIREENKDADFLFNLTHGKKVIPLYLFTMAVWIDGKPYYVERNGEIVEFNIPRIHADELAANGNLALILSILHENVGDSERGMAYGDVYDVLSEKYVPSNYHKAGRPPKLSRGTFSKWVRKLMDSNLIRAEFEVGSFKSKLLYLTNDGIFTYEFFKRQNRN